MEPSEEVARRYFDALDRRDLDAMAACWAPDGREHIRGQVDTTGPDGVRAYFASLFGAVPDARTEVVAVTAAGERAVVRWRLRGTFGGTPHLGIAATGAPLELEGIDELTVRDGAIAANEAFTDNMDFARQIGMLPREGTPADRAVTRAFNVRTRAARAYAGAQAEPIADGVWIVRGGVPRTMDVYLVAEPDGGVTAFDAGVASMAPAIRAAAAGLGGLRRVVLGHGHADHRGAAPALGVPVLCHPAERADAEGDGGDHYFDLSKLTRHGRLLLGTMLPQWDGGPAEISGTVEEGDDVAGFEVVHLPGHAPGLIGLWRASDGLVLASDCVYTLDPETGRPGAPRVPHAAFNYDQGQAVASVAKLAALRPQTAWFGHAGPLRGDVAGQLAGLR